MANESKAIQQPDRPGVFPVREEDIPWLIEQLETAQSVIAELTRELPCGCHPRLESLGKPAKFTGGCESPVIASLAIVCADCGAWYCSLECISKHFGNEPNEALSSLKQERDRLAEENQKLREALTAYSNPDNWDFEYGRSAYSLVFTAAGQQFGDGHGWERAKKALAAFGEGEEKSAS